MTARTWLTSLAAAGLLIAATGCSSEDSPSSSPENSRGSPDAAVSSTPASPAPTSPNTETESSAPAQEPAVITIKDFEYSGPESVAPGTEIMVINQDDAAHTVTAEGDGGFDVTIAPGESATFTAPSEAGEYPYICTFHANMSGTLVVE